MSLENLQGTAEEPSPSALRAVAHPGGEAATDTPRVVVFKFGGSSLLGADRMLHAASLVRAAVHTFKVAVVVSAMKGVTDGLLSIAEDLARGKPERARREAESILHLHFDVLHDLCLREEHSLCIRREIQLLGRDLLHEVPLHGPVVANSELYDRLASFGERFCARLFAAALEKLGITSVPVTSSEFVITCDTFREAKPHLDLTKRRGREILLPLLDTGIVPVVTGFIGSTADGRIATLGRNSSDFSGAIVAYVLDAAELVIWTDVDGIFTANPSECAEARLLHELSYDEAHALVASGAKVLHAKVLPLAAETEMVVWIRNAFNPQARGTRIASSRAAQVSDSALWKASQQDDAA